MKTGRDNSEIAGLFGAGFVLKTWARRVWGLRYSSCESIFSHLLPPPATFFLLLLTVVAELFLRFDCYGY